MKEYGILSHKFSDIDDAELDDMVRGIITLFPNCGEKTVSGRLRSNGVRILRGKVRESMRRVDPSGLATHCRNVLHRHVYEVSSSNALWHVDGYHKLMRWHFVIHGGIDGFSRLITYLKVATNNLADTVLGAFLCATDEYGLPSRGWTEAVKTSELPSLCLSILSVGPTDTVLLSKEVYTISELNACGEIFSSAVLHFSIISSTTWKK